MRLNKNVLLIAALLCGLFLLASCGDTPTTNTTNTTNAANTTNTTPVNTTNMTPANDNTMADNKDTTSLSADKIGVAECDEYIEKYEACVKEKVPEAQRAAMQDAFDKSREAWRKAAETPQGKAGLATACKTAMETAKKSMEAFGCKW